jgi:hypothetical protein
VLIDKEKNSTEFEFSGARRWKERERESEGR